jgi:DNA-binding CsgD family transcriptional regulator
MALVDRDLRFVDINDATAALFQARREDVIGQPAGTEFVGGRSSIGSAEWQKLVQDNELYGERVIKPPGGTPLRVGYAAHATAVDGDWLALFVILSAKVEPHGNELIRAAVPDSAGGVGDELEAFGSQVKSLTPREREVVRRVALGRSTPQIAADLSLSPATVRSHVRNAMVKMGAHTRAQLVALVLGEGLSGRSRLSDR